MNEYQDQVRWFEVIVPGDHGIGWRSIGDYDTRDQAERVAHAVGNGAKVTKRHGLPS